MWLLAAAVLAVAVIAGVLIFGVDRPPQVDTVTADTPHTPPARIAWWTWDDGRGCLYVADTDGSVRELTCADVPGGVVGWTPQGILMQEEPGLAQAMIATLRRPTAGGAGRRIGRAAAVACGCPPG